MASVHRVIRGIGGKRLVVVLCLAVLCVPLAAYGQETTSPAPGQAQAASAPLASLASVPIQVQVWPEAEEGRTVLIVGATLPTETVLPATVRLPIPQGAELLWSGEVTAGAPEEDVQRPGAVVETGAGEVVEFVIEQEHSFQYEAYIASPETDGDRIASKLEWVHAVESLELSVAWRIPAGNDDVTLVPDAPGTPLTNSRGESLYTLAPLTPGPGDTLTFEASYVRAGTQATEEGGGPDILTILIVVLAVAVGALIVALVIQRWNASESQE